MYRLTNAEDSIAATVERAIDEESEAQVAALFNPKDEGRLVLWFAERYEWEETRDWPDAGLMLRLVGPELECTKGDVTCLTVDVAQAIIDETKACGEDRSKRLKRLARALRKSAARLERESTARSRARLPPAG